MYKAIATVTVIVLLSICTGCSHRVGDFTALSTKNIYCKDTDITQLEQHQGAEGKDITFLGIGADPKDAADRAMEQYDGNLLIDAVIYVESSFLFGGYKVRGTSVKVPYNK
ncbi:MAG: hypothetical protein JXM79_22360 [Sedimentisphaerales bacterium]|nr:hypothetical protein [Sedimentisphaerales bacterium]